MLDLEGASIKRSRVLVSGGSKKFLKKTEELKEYQREYLTFISFKLQEQSIQDVEPDTKIMSSLDGSYWRQ